MQNTDVQLSDPRPTHACPIRAESTRSATLTTATRSARAHAAKPATRSCAASLTATNVRRPTNAVPTPAAGWSAIARCAIVCRGSKAPRPQFLVWSPANSASRTRAVRTPSAWWWIMCSGARASPVTRSPSIRSRAVFRLRSRCWRCASRDLAVIMPTVWSRISARIVSVCPASLEIRIRYHGIS